MTGSSSKIWDTYSGSPIHSFPHNHIVRSVALSPTSSHLLTGGQEKKVRIFDLNRPDAEPDFLCDNGILSHDGMVKSVVWIGDHTGVTAGEDGKIKWWDLRTRNLTTTLTFPGPITSMEWSAPTQRLVVTSGSTVGFIPGLPSANDMHTLTLPYIPSSASIHPILQDRFVTGNSGDEWVRVHGMDGEEREVLKGHHGPVHCVEYSPDGEMYASGSAMSRHRRQGSSSNPPRSPSPPTLTYHHPTLLPIPTPALVESVAGAAHYSGVKLEQEPPLKHRRSSHDYGENHTQLKPSHQRILDDLQELYGCRPTQEIFERTWHPDAVFEDPLSLCRGYSEYAAQWYAMSKLFSASKTLLIRVMSSTHSPNRLVFSLSQEYTYRVLHRKKTIHSVVVVDLDEDEKIVKMVDQWNGKDLPRWHGAHFLRVANAKLVPWLSKLPHAIRYCVIRLYLNPCTYDARLRNDIQKVE
ncbi:hypothetical protein C0991_006156 [Blastosporella zonata]|nr:hypothetical protein C0991_006156 [Blastosporella zonata]